MVTHDLLALTTLCDRIAALSAGGIVVAGTLAEVLECPDPWVKSYFRDVASAPARSPTTT